MLYRFYNIIPAKPCGLSAGSYSDLFNLSNYLLSFNVLIFYNSVD